MTLLINILKFTKKHQIVAKNIPSRLYIVSSNTTLMFNNRNINYIS